MNKPRAIAVGFVLLAAGAISFLTLAGLRKSRDSVEVPDASAARVDTLFAEWNRSDSAGCSVGVSRNALPVLERGYGMANLELRVPITPVSVFHVASVSKQFTAMSILLLSQRGKLSLDDEVRKHIPEWADHGNRLTIRHLLTHTGGLRDVFLLRELAPPPTGSGDMNDEIAALLARQRALNFAPGSEFQYSNSGYAVLATIVKRVSGQSLRAFADANIFKPLGMTQTHVHDDPRMIVPGRASGYHRDASGLRVAPHHDLGRLVGTTALHTTARDLLRWLDNFADPRVGDPALLAAMQTPTVLTGGDKSPYGFGLEIGEHRGLRTIAHGGGDPGFAAYVIRYPDRGLALAVLCNLDNIGSGIGELTRRVAENYLPDRPAAPSQSHATTNPPRVSLTDEELASKVGLYRDPANDTYGRILVRGGTLRAREGPGDGDTIELTPVSPTRFIVPGTPIEVEFVPATAGRPQQIRVAGAGPKPAVMDQVAVTFAPSATELHEFGGSYGNNELGVTYTLVARGTGLVLQMPGRSDVQLTPFLPDKFYGTLVEIVTFSRDARGVVTSFTVHTTGVRSLRFDRLKARLSAQVQPHAEHRATRIDEDTGLAEIRAEQIICR